MIFGAIFGFFAGIGIGTGVVAVITGALTVATFAVGIKGYLQLKDMMQQGQSILAQKTSAGGKIPVIYGSRRVGAQVVFMDTANNNSKHLFVVYALSVGEIENIDGRSIELDGASITDSARFRDGGYIGSDKISSGNGSLNTADQTGDSPNIQELTAGTLGTDPTDKYRFVLNLHHGAAIQTVDPMLNASIGSKWTTAHKLNGIAYIAATFKFDAQGKIWRGVPQLTVEVQGKKVFDPRDSGQTFGTPSTYEWSDNPALALLDYMTNDEYGKGLAEAQVNLSTFESAADLADGVRNNPDFNGSYRQIAWSGNTGNSYAYITSFAEWKKFKIGEYLTLKDNFGNTVVDNRLITGKNTYQFYNVFRLNIISWDSRYPLANNYSVTATTDTIIANAKRFQCNAYIDTNSNVMDNAKALLANMRGYLNYIEGKYELEIEDTGSSTFTITDEHIIADGGINVDYGNKDDKANVVVVEFFNGAKDYEMDTATVYHSATTNPSDYTSDDGGEILEIKAQFPYISDYYIAYNMAKTILTRSRYQTRVQFVGTAEMYKLNVNDIVTLSYTPLGFTGKVFRVEALELMPNGQLQVSLLEYFDVYTWTVPPQEKVGDPIDVPQSYAVKPPTSPTFIDTNASSTGRPTLSWTAPTDTPIKQYRVNVVDSSSNNILSILTDTTEIDLPFIPVATDYVASVNTINSNDVESSAATLTFTVGDEPVAEGDIQADAITANKINVTQLSSISSDLGSITGGSINIGSGNFTVDTAGNVVANSVTTRGKYLSKNITGTGQAGLFSQLSDSVTGGSDPLRILCPSDDSDKDFFILMGDDPYNMTFSSGIPTSANYGLWFTGTGSIYMGGTNDSFSPLADNSNDLGRLNNRWDDVYATNGTIQTSDANDKSNIADSDLGLSFVSQLTPRKYTLNDGDSSRTHYGLIAQEVKTVLDNNNINTSDFAPYIKGEILDTNNQGTGEYKHGLRYTELISILIKAIQELEQRIQDLEN